MENAFPLIDNFGIEVSSKGERSRCIVGQNLRKVTT